MNEFELFQRVVYVEPSPSLCGSVGTVVGASKDENRYAVEFEDGREAVVPGEFLADLDQRQVDALYEDEASEAPATPSHLDLFLAFAKAAGLWVRATESEDWIVASSWPHYSLVNLFFGEGGRLDRISVQYDDPRLRHGSYEDAYPNIL